MLWHLPKGSIFQSYRIDKLVKERPYGDPLHRCSLSLTAVPLCPAGEALVTPAKQTSCKPIADPAAARISEHVRYFLHATGWGMLPCGGMPPIRASPSSNNPRRTARAPYLSRKPSNMPPKDSSAA